MHDGFCASLCGEVSEYLGELLRHIDPPCLAILGAGDLASDIIAADRQEASLEINIPPLQGECFAKPHACSSETEKQRVMGRCMLVHCGEKLREFVPSQRVNVLLGLVTPLEKAPYTCGRIPWDELFFDRMVEASPVGE